MPIPFQFNQFEAGRHYRFHARVKSDDGASFNARVYGSNTAGLSQIDIGLNEHADLSELTEISSDIFIVPEEEFSTGRIFLYRQNLTGTLQVIDAWLEDVSDQVEFSSYYWFNHNQSLSADDGKKYKIFVEAHSGSPLDVGLGIICYGYDENNQSVPGAQTTIIWNKALDKDFKIYGWEHNKICGFDDERVRYMKVGIYNTNYVTQANNPDKGSITLKRIWAEEQ